MGPGNLARRRGVIKATALSRKPREGEEGIRSADLAGSALLVSKPGIASGVALAGLAGMVLAAKGVPRAGVLVPCLASVLAAASGSAVINGILDAPLDERMPRLKGRVEAMKRVGSEGALSLALGLILASLLVSYLFLHGLTVALVLAAVLSYTILYTCFLKRRSPYGTIPGGIPGALPVLIGYSAVAGRIGMDGVILFLAMILWQPPHFWALALAHREEYREAGIPVLPVALGEPYTKILLFLYAVSLLPATLALWAFGYCSVFFAWAAFALWSGFLWSCYRNVVVRSRYRRAFGASILYILGILAAVIADVLLRGGA
ncbi:MAG TPA: protoheme IX farnesyltransferase [Candidatus Deferrimicrobiaceae bacterium]|nr:protoheme IX farnesyltransferase [Candidatus Deferrimicrobiaceae bacterium]